MMKIAWEKYKNDKKDSENYQNTKNDHYSRRITFTLSLGFIDIFDRISYPKRPKMSFGTEVLFQRFWSYATSWSTLWDRDFPQDDSRRVTLSSPQSDPNRSPFTLLSAEPTLRCWLTNEVSVNSLDAFHVPYGWLWHRTAYPHRCELEVSTFLFQITDSCNECSESWDVSVCQFLTVKVSSSVIWDRPPFSSSFTSCHLRLICPRPYRLSPKL